MGGFSVEGVEFARFFGARVWLEPCVLFFFWGGGGFRQCGWRVLVYVWVIGKGLMFFVLSTKFLLVILLL